MSTPSKLIVEYDDGSVKEMAFGKVSREIRTELSKLGLCSTPGGIKASRNYLLLKWQDGWQEVVGVDKDEVDLLRYYIIERVEDRGRLSLEVGAEYPELFIIKRTPKELNSLLILSENISKLYELEGQVERREGIFEAGGKKEYVKYDKTDSRYPQRFNEEPEEMEKILNSVHKELVIMELNPKALLALDETERIEIYQQVATRINIRGMERQEDVYSFIEFMVERLIAGF
ncbi:MAG: hypothetical protein JRC68_01970 [Deltaproteobacteria bacterium]|nr:hypothetical protein [Deltaproteobacteria bacterium]